VGPVRYFHVLAVKKDATYADLVALPPHVVAATANPHNAKKLRLLVKYLPGQSTYGSTFRPSS